MSSENARVLTRMPVRYDSIHDFQLQIQMEEEPVLPLLSTFATLTLSTLSSALTTSPSPTNEELDPNLNDQLRNSYNQDDSIDKRKPQIHTNNVACEIAKRFKHCMPQTPGESELHRAAFNGDIEYLRSLLNDSDSTIFKRERINQKNRLGCTPIRLAATGGHVECLSLLIDAGASIDVVDVKCQTPLFVAIKNRRLKCALKLLQCGAKPEGDPGNSSTPLYVAIMNGDVRYLQLLLEYGADPDKLRHSRVSLAIQNNKFTSLNMAIDNFGGEEDILIGVKALLKAGCGGEYLDLLNIILNDYLRVLDLLYDFGIPLGSKEKIVKVLAEFPRNNACKERLQFIGENPRSLMSACRIATIKSLQPCHDFEDLNSLPLPNALLSYITHTHEHD